MRAATGDELLQAIAAAPSRSISGFDTAWPRRVGADRVCDCVSRARAIGLRRQKQKASIRALRGLSPAMEKRARGHIGVNSRRGSSAEGEENAGASWKRFIIGVFVAPRSRGNAIECGRRRHYGARSTRVETGSPGGGSSESPPRASARPRGLARRRPLASNFQVVRGTVQMVPRRRFAPGAKTRFGLSFAETRFRNTNDPCCMVYRATAKTGLDQDAVHRQDARPVGSFFPLDEQSKSRFRLNGCGGETRPNR